MDLKDGITPELDELSATLIGDALDLLAEGSPVDVLLVVQDVEGALASYVFSDDGPEECLEAAYSCLADLSQKKKQQEAQIKEPQRCALAYVGAVADESGAYQDALLLEFGEKGYKSYSAYSYIDNVGAGADFMWTDPAPAGELDPLL